jgi:hypothetical protein
MEWDEARPHAGHSTYEPSPQGVPFLLGPVSSVTFIPTLWGRGTFPAHAFVVKQATRRRLQLNALADKKLQLQPGQPLRPKIWSKDSTAPLDGLKQLEAHWDGVSAAGVSRRTELLPAIFLPSAPRRPPRDRSQAAPLAAAPTCPSSSATPADEEDQAESHTPPDPAVTQVWKELCQPDIHRPARITAWRILHGSLMVGAFYCHVYKQGATHPDRFCPHTCCQEKVANLTHTFLHCSIAAPVVQYIQAFWHWLDPRATPLPPEALLTADSRSWAPSQPFKALWVRLRVSYLQAVWGAYQQARCSHRTPSSASIASTTLHYCHKNMLQDWQLSLSGLRALTADGFTKQLSGPSAATAREAFFEKWGGEGVLCALECPDRLAITWTRQSPVRMPGF